MNNITQYIIEKLKINSDSKVHKELDTFENFAKEYDGEFSKGSIIFKEDSIFYRKVLDILSIKDNRKIRIIKDRISANSTSDKYRYYVAILELTSMGINISCVERKSATHVSFMYISRKSNNQLKLTYGVNDPDESIEKTYVNIILNNIINGKFN